MEFCSGQILLFYVIVCYGMDVIYRLDTLSNNCITY